MKKILINSLIITCLTTFSVVAQDSSSSSSSGDSRENFRFGVKAGVNFANVYDEEGEDFVADGKVGFAGGVFATIPLGKIFGVQPELIYSEKGFKSTGDILGIEYDGKRTTSYLDIPVHLQIKPVENFSILVGPQFSYLLKTKNEFNGLSSEQEEEINDENFKKGVIGLSVGIDYSLNNFLLSARGSWDLSKTDTDGDTSDIRYKNQVIQLTVGYIF